MTFHLSSTPLPKNSMNPFKAPEPDGFQCIFFKKYWHIMSDDIFNLVNNVFSSSYVHPSISNTLIHKVDIHSTTFKNLRPISICNIVYKIINKVLINRLRPLRDIIIGPYQISFLLGRVLLTMLLFCWKYFTTCRSPRIIIVV